MPRIGLRMIHLLLSSTNRQTTPRENRARTSRAVFWTGFWAGTNRTNAANNQQAPKHRRSDAAPTPLAQSADPLRTPRCFSVAVLGSDAADAGAVACRRSFDDSRNTAARRRAAYPGPSGTAA